MLYSILALQCTSTEGQQKNVLKSKIKIKSANKAVTRKQLKSLMMIISTCITFWYHYQMGYYFSVSVEPYLQQSSISITGTCRLY